MTQEQRVTAQAEPDSRTHRFLVSPRRRQRPGYLRESSQGDILRGVALGIFIPQKTKLAGR